MRVTVTFVWGRRRFAIEEILARALSCRGLGAGADCGLLGGVGVTTGWGETEVLMGVSSRRLAPVKHRHLAARGLLSLFGLLRRAFLLNVIKRNQAK